MTQGRLLACAPVLAFAALAAALAGVGAVPATPALLAALSVTVAFLPSGVLRPGGWRRRAAEAMLLPVAFALAMVGDPTQRTMALPPLLLASAMAACAAAIPRLAGRRRTVVVVALTLATRAATGLAFVGSVPWRAPLAVALTAALAAAAARTLGDRAAMLAAVLAGALPLERLPLPAQLIAGAAAASVVLLAPPRGFGGRAGRGWSAAAVAVALVASTLAPWGGLRLGRAFPHAGWAAAAAGGVALAVTPFLPVAAAGAAWLGAAALLGPAQPAPPDRPGFALTASEPEAAMPESQGGRYVLDLTLSNAAAIRQGDLVATVYEGGRAFPIRAGSETAEWAHERADVRPVVAHTLPASPVWSPTGTGAAVMWAVTGRVAAELPPGVRPRLVRAPGLPASVGVNVVTAGTSRASPPRNWPLTAWILAAAIAVAGIQLVAGTARGPAAWVPWAMLVALTVASRTAVAPLGLLAERHGVDLALAALLAAWLPAARAWLARGRVFATAAALLVPLAVGTAHLMPPGGDAQYHLIVLRSLAQDHDLDLANNYDLEHRPENSIYITSVFLHSPVLAFVLLPGYLAAGLPGALVVMALLGAGLVAAVARAATRLGLPGKRRALLVSALLATYPLATFATQMWVEVPGALLAALALLCVGQPRPRIGVAALASFAATSLKTRLALATFPISLAALAWRRRSRRELAVSLLAVGAAIAAGLAFGVLVYGHPLGPFRSLASLLPRTLRQPLVVLGGFAFDASGGLLFSAPLLAVALAGSGRLWREGGPAGRGALLAGALTVAALLNSPEWYGGGCPPVRYLVPLLPALGLAAAMVLRGAVRWRRLGVALLPAAVVVWWVMVSRPHLGFNPGDGGSWLADALARRFAADARHLFPSFLRISTAAYVVPAAIVVAGGLAVLASWRRPGFARASARLGVSLWLAAGCAVVLTLRLRTDRVVELEDPQVARIGGRPEPPAGTFSRFLVPNGWRVGDAEGIEAPLHLPSHAALRLEGWLVGPARHGGGLLVSWDGGPPRRVAVAGDAAGSVEIPGVPAGGRHRLRLTLEAPAGGEAVLDRLVVRR